LFGFVNTRVLFVYQDGKQWCIVTEIPGEAYSSWQQSRFITKIKSSSGSD